MPRGTPGNSSRVEPGSRLPGQYSFQKSEVQEGLRVLDPTSSLHEIHSPDLESWDLGGEVAVGGGTGTVWLW